MNWHDIKSWCHQGQNSADDLDVFGLCSWAMCGNHLVLQGRGVMSPGEIENAAREMTGFSPLDHSTDKGIALETLFRYVQERGWPGDPTLRIASWNSVEFSDLNSVIKRRKGAECWLALPTAEDGPGYDFSDGALFRGAAGVYPHAVEVVDAPGRDLTFITWGAPQTVSRSWADAYFRGAFETVWQDIT